MKMRPLLGVGSFHLFAIVFVLTEAITNSVFNNVIYIFTYSVYRDMPTEMVPYLVTYLEPSKHVCRVIIILYIPVLCLWRAGRLVVRRTYSSASASDEVVNFEDDMEEMENELIEKSSSDQMQPVPMQHGMQKLLKRITLSPNVVQLLQKNGKQENGRVYSSKNGFQLRPWKSHLNSIPLGEKVHETENKHQNILRQYNKMFTLYRKLPLKKASRAWGWVHQLELPVWLRSPVLRLYIWLFGCSLDDASIQDLRHYENLSKFFRRTLRPGIRPIDNNSALTSPADGTALHFGPLKDGVMEQVKGVTYSLRGFVGPWSDLFLTGKVSSSSEFVWTSPDQQQQFLDLNDIDMDDVSYHTSLLSNPENCLYQCIIYLAPGDYHHFHSPTNWTVLARRHFPGELFSVNPGKARWLQGLFNFNERVMYSGRWKHGFFSMTAVGATLVGSINVSFDKSLQTNDRSSATSGNYFDTSFVSKKKTGIKMRKGQHFGDFNFGSTMVLLFEAPSSFCFNLLPLQKIKYGKGIGFFPKCLSSKCQRKRRN